MSKNIPESLRRQVAARANYHCEYCRRTEYDSFIRYQSDHIISRKHGGETTSSNLAHACPLCNNAKGTDLTTIISGETNPKSLLTQEYMIGLHISKLKKLVKSAQILKSEKQR